MSTDNVREILMLCEEFIPGDSGDPAEFFFDKVSGQWSVMTEWAGMTVSRLEPGELCFCAGDVPIGQIPHSWRRPRLDSAYY